MTDQIPPNPRRKVNWKRVAAGAGRILGAFSDEDAVKPAPGAAVKDQDLAGDFITAVDELTQAVRALTKAVKTLTKEVGENTEAMYEDEDAEEGN